jgi:hypothetical protein
MGIAACGGDGPATPARDAAPPGDAAAAGDGAPADAAPVPPDADRCEPLFGLPNARTGLAEAQCRPVCEACAATPFVPRVWDDAAIAALRAYTLVAPPARLSEDPYAAAPPAPEPEGAVCAVVIEDLPTKRYRLETMESAEMAAARGAYVTHAGACGLCSSLADLAVYASTPDLTAPVRDCGLASRDHAALVACIEGLGFSGPCADVWAFNTEHTRAACAEVCLRLLRAPYHEPDGRLNACLQCDEDCSGAVFKAVAGRTRRNSGVPSAMCRPCSEVPRIAHDYP